MYITNHGGFCCGIRHIHGLGDNPSAKIYSAIRTPNVGLNGTLQAFNYNRPVETRGERLSFLVAECKEVWSHGLIEIVLAVHIAEEACSDPDCDCDRVDESFDQVADWEGVLVDLGFKMVTSFLNSNTYNMCHVYHLAY